MRIIWFTDGPPCVGAIHTGQHGTAMPSGAVHPNMYPGISQMGSSGVLGSRLSRLRRSAGMTAESDESAGVHMAQVQLRNVIKRFDSTEAVRGINLDIADK